LNQKRKSNPGRRAIDPKAPSALLNYKIAGGSSRSSSARVTSLG
jgi:hypothetical protein